MLGGALVGISMLPNAAANADTGKEAYEKGISDLLKQDYDAAITAFTEAIRLNPGPQIVFCKAALPIRKRANLSRLLPTTRRPSGSTGTLPKRIADEAIPTRTMANSTMRSPTSPMPFGSTGFARAYENRGWVFDQQGEHDKAIADHSQAIRLTRNLSWRIKTGAGPTSKKANVRRR